MVRESALQTEERESQEVGSTAHLWGWLWDARAALRTRGDGYGMRGLLGHEPELEEKRVERTGTGREGP